MTDNLIRLSHGLRRDPEHVAEPSARAAALLSVCPAGSVLAGFTAARLHGLWLPSAVGEERLEVIVHRDGGPPNVRSYNKRLELRSRRQHLATDEVVELRGLPVTSLARTWLDLAASLRDGDLVALGDSALRAGARLSEMTKLVIRARHRPGVVRARRVLPMLDPRSRSHPESWLRWVVLDAGLPRPEVNVAIFDDRHQWLCEPDLSYFDVRLALEYNGHHHADVDRMRADITRTIDVEERGSWRVVVFGPTEVYRRPDLVVRRVRSLRAECAARLGLSGLKQS